MTEYKYKGYTFWKVHTTTEVILKAPNGNPYTAIRNLYEIDGLKEAGKRPFLTSVAQCKEYINETV